MAQNAAVELTAVAMDRGNGDEHVEDLFESSDPYVVPGVA
jgi:hypothetical protein